MRMDTHCIAKLIRETAEAEVLSRFCNLQSGEVREKSPGDFVTEADVQAEKVLTRRLKDILPGSLVVGEEAVAADRDVLLRLDKDEPVWVIDPVDGTRNFAHSHPMFAVIVALVRGGQTLLGWIYDPVNEVMAIAEAGGGTWIDGDRMQVAPDLPLSRMQGSAGYRDRNDPLVLAVDRLVHNHSAAHDYLQLIQGQLHFASYRRLNPWDHAAGVLMHAEAGGYSALLDSRPYRPVAVGRGLLLAPSEASWHELVQLAG